MKRILSLFLAAAMTAALLAAPAAASAAPWVELGGRGTASQTVTLRDLPGPCHGVQLTLTLDREDVSFTFDGKFSREGSHAAISREGTALTLYATGKEAASGDLALGALTADQPFTVLSVTVVKLVSLDPDNAAEQTFDSVGTSAPGQGGGSGPIFSGGTSGYSVTMSGTEHGSVRLDTATARQGQTVTVTVSPDAGYGVDRLTVTDSAGRELAVTGLGGGRYSFVMPAGPVTVSAAFAPLPEQDPVVLPFTDVKEDSWFRGAVAYVYEHGLMNGTSRTTFSPDGVTTRGMIVTILHRMEGAPETGVNRFPDVAEGKFYTGAVAWAAANGIVKGYNDGRFGPDDVITREQMAAILYRYAQYKGYDVSGQADLSAYYDAAQVSGFAREAMAWANYAGLITGASGNTLLLPVGSATRSQAATILMRFCENVA